uniref:Uncharacterized protein n=1 Tax=Rhizophora mucronata TaxID=61149 RepID=A0A2P2MA35_RHIMU
MVVINTTIFTLHHSQQQTQKYQSQKHKSLPKFTHTHKSSTSRARKRSK